MDDSQMSANTAHSCRVGFVYLSEASPQCSRVSNAIAHHTTEVGVVYDRSGVNMEVKHVLLSDNRIGLAIMPWTRLDSGHVDISRTAAIGFSNNGGALLTSRGHSLLLQVAQLRLSAFSFMPSRNAFVLQWSGRACTCVSQHCTMHASCAVMHAHDALRRRSTHCDEDVVASSHPGIIIGDAWCCRLWPS